MRSLLVSGLAIISLLVSVFVAAEPVQSSTLEHHNVPLTQFKHFVFANGNSASTSEVSAVIQQEMIYTGESRIGFDFATADYADINNSGLFAKESVYFSVMVPEGQYQVTLTLGSDKHASINTVKAESRRLMLNQLSISKGHSQDVSFVVDVRTPQISPSQKSKGGQIAIKDREKDDLNWDDKLTLEFSANTAVQALSIEAVSHLPSIYLAGDSTVTDQDIEPWASWGQLFTQYLSTQIVVSNYAVSGASLHSFKQSKRLEKILSVIKPGDYLFIQFAHNDEKRKGEGIGPWQSYTELLKEYVFAAREKGATPVLLTPVQRRFFADDGQLKPTHGDYPAAVRAVANTLNVDLIDLTQLTTTLYENWGDERSRQAFVQYPANTFPHQPKALKDNTHFNYFGANEIALCVINGLVVIDSPLVKFIQTAARGYSPAKPNLLEDWSVPMSPRFTSVKPDGN